MNQVIDALAHVHDSMFADELKLHLNPSNADQEGLEQRERKTSGPEAGSRDEYFFRNDLNSLFKSISPKGTSKVVSKKDYAKPISKAAPIKSNMIVPETSSPSSIQLIVIEEVGSLIYDLDKGFDHCTPATRTVGSILAKIVREKQVPVIITSSILAEQEILKVGLSPWSNFAGDLIIMERCIFKEPHDPIKSEMDQNNRKPSHAVKKVVQSSLGGFYMVVPLDYKANQTQSDAIPTDSLIQAQSQEYITKFSVRLGLLSQTNNTLSRRHLNFEKKQKFG